MADPVKQIYESINDFGGLFVELEEAFRDADYKPALEPHLRGIEQLHGVYFQGQRDPNGDAWTPLAPATVKRKGHDTILVETTHLASSLIRQGSDAIRVVDDTGLTFGTSVEYATFHQTGTSRLPQRAMVGLSEQYVDNIATDISSRLIEELKAKP